MKIKISPLRMMAVSGVFIIIVWGVLLSTEGISMGMIIPALFVVVFGIFFAFFASLTVECRIDENGVHRGMSTVSWEGIASANIKSVVTAIVIYSPEANWKGWIAIPAPWFVANRSEIADWIESSYGAGNRLYGLFSPKSELRASTK